MALENMDLEQRQAVETTEGYVRVVAKAEPATPPDSSRNGHGWARCCPRSIQFNFPLTKF